MVSVLLMPFIAGFAICAPVTNRIHVAASIRPLHSIVASIMKDVAIPSLIVSNNQSAHHTTLKPSQARIIAEADILFWIGPELEAFLKKSVNAMGAKSAAFVLLKIDGLDLIQLAEGQIDPHIWLSTDNAVSIAKFIAGELVKADPKSSQTYEINLAHFLKEMKSLQIELEVMLASQKEKEYLVYHDALQYLESRFQFHTHPINIGNEEITPGARQIVEIGKLARSGKYQCMLVEPNINASAVISAAKEAELPIATLDPLGSGISAGPHLYTEMMRNLARTIASCSK